MSNTRYKPLSVEECKALLEKVNQQYAGHGLFERKQNSILYAEIKRALNINNEDEEAEHAHKLFREWRRQS